MMTHDRTAARVALTVFLEAGGCDRRNPLDGSRCEAKADQWTANLGRYCPEHYPEAEDSRK